jgi:hypothetical protein
VLVGSWRLKCCAESNSTRAFLSTCLAMFCTSATFTATALSSPSPPCHFLCTSHIPSLAFLPHHLNSCPRSPNALLNSLLPLWHICCLDTGLERLPFVPLPCWRYLWKHLILYFPKSPALQPDKFYFQSHILLPLTFPAPPRPVNFCDLTFHHSLSCSISHSAPHKYGPFRPTNHAREHWLLVYNPMASRGLVVSACGGVACGERCALCTAVGIAG